MADPITAHLFTIATAFVGGASGSVAHRIAVRLPLRRTHRRRLGARRSRILAPGDPPRWAPPKIGDPDLCPWCGSPYPATTEIPLIGKPVTGFRCPTCGHPDKAGPWLSEALAATAGVAGAATPFAGVVLIAAIPLFGVVAGTLGPAPRTIRPGPDRHFDGSASSSLVPSSTTNNTDR